MPLETRPYGQTGEKITVIGLGGVYLDKHSFNDGVATVHRALELGVRYFDTSPAYGSGGRDIQGVEDLCKHNGVAGLASGPDGA